MRLGRYLDVHDLTATQFADWVGVDRSTMHRWLTSQRYPEPKYLERVQSITNGQVTPNDFLDQWRECHPESK